MKFYPGNTVLTLKSKFKFLEDLRKKILIELSNSVYFYALICLSVYKQHTVFTRLLTSTRYYLRIPIIVAGRVSCNKIRGASCNSMFLLFFPYRRN